MRSCTNAYRWLILATILVGAPSSLFSQGDAVNWKYYTYMDDRFAIMFPDVPRIHPDAGIPNTTAYSSNINSDYAVTVRVRHGVQDCKALVQQLRTSVLAGKDAIPSSLKDRPSGLEYDFPVSESRVNHLRYLCGEGRVYILAVSNIRNAPLSTEAVKFLDSFREILEIKTDSHSQLVPLR